MAYINVVIPVYNAERYLLDTVRSVLESVHIFKNELKALIYLEEFMI